MILATYATFEQMHGRKSTIAELIERLKPFSRESVIYICSVTGTVLKLWQRGGWDKTNYDLLLASAFDPLRRDWYQLSARSKEPELVFHRRQLLLIMKLALEHCPEVGLDILNAQPGHFGTILLMANDQFHFGLYPFGEKNSSEREKVIRVLTEFVPVTEYSGFRIENRLARSYLLTTKYANELSEHPDFVDVSVEFEKTAGISLSDYHALAFALFARCGNVSLAALQENAWVAAVREANFATTAIPSATVQAFLSELSDSAMNLVASVQEARGMKRDFGPNDFTVFRRKPLVTEKYGHLPTDLMLVAEKFESGPYWSVSNTSRQTGDRLRRFWGAVFERYVNNEMSAAVVRSGATFIPDPRCADKTASQVCDGILIEGECAVILEYKSSMFTARGKYGGDHALLKDELVTKLVHEAVEGKKKGVEQLADAIKLLFTDVTKEIVKGLDLSKIRHVYPLLITLDDIGSTLLLSRFLNTYFDEFLDRKGFGTVEVKPLFCTDVESLEVVLPYSRELPISGFLDNWLTSDPTLMATLLAYLPDGLSGERNNTLDAAWKELYDRIASRLFPKEHASAKRSDAQAGEVI